MSEHLLHFKPDGSAKGLQTDRMPASKLGNVILRERVSHIWPAHPLKQLAFRIIRRLCRPEGKVHQWTRTWEGPWIVLIKVSTQHDAVIWCRIRDAKGNVRKFCDRDDALAFERRFMEARLRARLLLRSCH